MLVVPVGGGPAGVETAGELAYHYPGKTLVLVDAAERLLSRLEAPASSHSSSSSAAAAAGSMTDAAADESVDGVADDDIDETAGDADAQAAAVVAAGAEGDAASGTSAAAAARARRYMHPRVAHDALAKLKAAGVEVVLGQKATVGRSAAHIVVGRPYDDHNPFAAASKGLAPRPGRGYGQRRPAQRDTGAGGAGGGAGAEVLPGEDFERPRLQDYECDQVVRGPVAVTLANGQRCTADVVLYATGAQIASQQLVGGHNLLV